MRNFNFNNVDEASENSYTEPGTIAVFTIAEVKFDTTQNGKDYMEVKFDESPTASMTHRFYMSEKALPRVQSLYKAVVGAPLQGENITEQQIIAALTGKQVALKITGRLYEGKIYSDLPFGGFCKAPNLIGELAFTQRETNELESMRAQAAMATAAAPQQNGTAGAPVQATGGADDF